MTIFQKMNRSVSPTTDPSLLRTGARAAATALLAAAVLCWSPAAGVMAQDKSDLGTPGGYGTEFTKQFEGVQKEYPLVALVLLEHLNAKAKLCTVDEQCFRATQDFCLSQVPKNSPLECLELANSRCCRYNPVIGP